MPPPRVAARPLLFLYLSGTLSLSDGLNLSGALSTLLFSSFSSNDAFGAVFRCALADGGVLYTQFNCPPESTHRLVTDRDEDAAGAFSIVTPAELSVADRRALVVLEAELKQDRQERQRQRARNARVRAKQQAATRTRCSEAEAALERLARTRRKGYSATEHGRFEAEQSHWRDQRRANC